MMINPLPNRAPLMPERLTPLPIGAIRVEGPMRVFLIELRANLGDAFDSLHPQAGLASAWYGGPLAGGLLAPTLLEARLLLSAALGDSELRQKALSFIPPVLEHQHSDGQLGGGETFEARGRMLRALSVAYAMTGDKGILLAILRYFKYLREALKAQPLGPSDALHIADTLEAGLFFYNISGQKAVLPVLRELEAQSAAFTSLYHTFPYKLPLSRSLTPEAYLQADPASDSQSYAHQLARMANGTHLAEGLRTSALLGILTGSGKHLTAPEIGLVRLNKAHGSVSGAYTCDPLLGGTHPARGIQTRAIGQLARSLETMLRLPGGDWCADQWETLLFNAAASAFAPNLRGVQSVTQTNQVELSQGVRFPYLPDQDNRYGTDDAQTLSEMLCVFPRYIQNLWMQTPDGGLAAMSYVPCKLLAHVADKPVRIAVEGDYPAQGNVTLRLSLREPLVFAMHLRIPSWAKGASVSVSGETFEAEAGTTLTLCRQWHDGEMLYLTLPMQAEMIPGPHQAVTLSRGPIRYCYTPEHETVEANAGERRMCGTPVALSRQSSFEPVALENGKVALRALVHPLHEWSIQQGILNPPPIDLPAFDQAPIETLLRPMAECPVRIAVLPIESR